MFLLINFLCLIESFPTEILCLKLGCLKFDVVRLELLLGACNKNVQMFVGEKCQFIDEG